MYTITACLTSLEMCRMACGQVPVCLPPIILAVLPEGTLVQRLIRVHRDSIAMLTAFMLLRKLYDGFQLESAC